MKYVKLCLITLLVLEVLAIATHLNELMSLTGNVFNALLPIFAILAVIVWMIKG